MLSELLGKIPKKMKRFLLLSFAAMLLLIAVVFASIENRFLFIPKMLEGSCVVFLRQTDHNRYRRGAAGRIGTSD
jgi:hypothetical protein